MGTAIFTHRTNYLGEKRNSFPQFINKVLDLKYFKSAFCRCLRIIKKKTNTLQHEYVHNILMYTVLSHPHPE